MPVWARSRGGPLARGSSVNVPDRQGRADRFPSLQRRFAKLQQQRVIQRLVQPMILPDLAISSDLRSDFRLIKDFAKIQSAGFPVLDGLFGLQPIRTPEI